MTKRFKPDIRKDEIVAVALRLAAKTHYKQVQRKQVADALGVTPPAITYHFGTMGQLQKAIMRRAVDSSCLKVIAQGLVANDKQAQKAPADVRQKAVGLFM